VIEDSTILRPGEAGVFAQTETRVRRTVVEEPGKYGVVVQAPVKMSGSTVRGSKGWGVEVQEQGRLELVECTVEGSHGANLDVKNATVYARGCLLAKGVSSGVTLQDRAHATFIDTKIEDNAQGSLFTLPGAHVLAAGCAVRGQGPGVFLQGARAMFVRTAIEGAPAVDVRGEPLLQEGGPAFLGCTIKGESVVRAGSTARFGACTTDPPARGDDGATVTIDPDADVEAELQKALASRG
jgi:hypothetical protein